MKLIKLQQIVGVPVTTLDVGKQVGTIKDAWFDEYWQLQGLVIEFASWFATSLRVIPWSEVVSCGEDVILISSESKVQRLKPQQITRSFFGGISKLKDMPIVTVQGTQLGRVSDVYFLPFQGTQIVGYELTDGFVSDLMEGRKWLNVSNNSNDIKLGDDAIIVPPISEAELEPVAASNFMK
ncbi:PRC-barrel domain-containing protein [Paenibacillus yanchengensis]|uniref:PRC-barrel domain-containing protein n=1 Tax=Paenibacillus yanchengensis TaxID=2035833 RepID=A0ABW4YLN0_9BACL